MADFSDTQKRYLEGFAAGAAIARLRTADAQVSGTAPATPRDIHDEARARAVAAGGKLVPEEEAKARKQGLDLWDEIRAHASEGRFPRGTDVFLWKFHGLFHVAPAQDAFMCRLRIPGGQLAPHQLAGLADLAERHAGGYAHVTTRANLQLREIAPASAPAVLMGLADLGLTSRGAGADNIRNVTGTPTAGIDPGELIDTQPFCRELHHHILNHREMYGLPRKFNIAFDGGGAISSLDDTNDIGFFAVRVPADAGIEPGVYFRVRLGGITGHRDFARDAGVVVRPQECVEVASAIVRVFIERGDRTNRQKARMKYVLDQAGHAQYLAWVEEKLGRALTRLAPEACAPRPRPDRMGHVGVHPQKQPGLNYAGLALPVGRMDAAQMRGLAAIAARHGGSIRLTVWQNLLVTHIPDAALGHVQGAVEALGLPWHASPVRAGLVACTGNTGCKFSASDTKRHAMAIADYVEPRVALATPVNIHLTGCHHSCAQHYIGDIGLIAAKVDIGEDEAVEGYHVHVGGGAGDDAGLAREVARDVVAEDAPEVVRRLLAAYLAGRASESETFIEYARRQDAAALAAAIGPPRELAA